MLHWELLKNLSALRLGDNKRLSTIVVGGPGGIDLGVGPAALEDEAKVALRLAGVGRFIALAG